MKMSDNGNASVPNFPRLPSFRNYQAPICLTLVFLNSQFSRLPRISSTPNDFSTPNVFPILNSAKGSSIPERNWESKISSSFCLKNPQLPSDVYEFPQLPIIKVVYGWIKARF